MKANPLPRSEQLKVDAAEGWLMLGCTADANDELEKIPPHFRLHPHVLSVRWQVYAAAEWWEAAWVVSKALCEMFPQVAEVWVCHANTVRKYKGDAEAKATLIGAHSCFPDDPVITYNLACYSAALNELDEACNWLINTFEKKETDALKVAALYDPDLKPLWEKMSASHLLIPLPSAAMVKQAAMSGQD